MMIFYSEKYSPSLQAFAIFIACLGLLGLILIYNCAENKGNRCAQSIGRFRSEYCFFIVEGFYQAHHPVIPDRFTPLAWYVMHNWLQGFAYRIPISWWIFPSAGLLAFFIAIGTVSFQTMKAAGMNPVTSLRSE